MLPTSAAVHHKIVAAIRWPLPAETALRDTPRTEGTSGRRGFNGGRGTSGLPYEGVHRRAVPGRGVRRDVRDREPGHGPADRDDRIGRRSRHRRGGPRRAPGIRRRALVAAGPGRAQGGPPPLRRPARGEPRGTRAPRLAGGRQADHRHPRGRRPGCRPDLPLVRRGDRQGLRRRRADRSGRPRPDRPRADRRGGRGGALELPPADGDLEGRPGPRGRQQPDHQARAADVDVGASDGRAGVRGRATGWRLQRRAGLWLRGRPGTRAPHGRRHGDVHRLDGDRPPVPALLGGEQPQGDRA